MHNAGWGPDKQYEVLEKLCSEYDRFVPPREIWDAIANSEQAFPRGVVSGRRSRSHGQDSSHAVGIKKDLLEQVPERTLDDLLARSDPVPKDMSLILKSLYPGDPWICIGRSDRMGDHRTIRLSHLMKKRYWTTYDLIVPNPMKAETGRTQQGKISPRTKKNAGPPIYAVFESDQYSGDFDTQASIILWFAERLPLKMVVHSGNKSLHAWYDASGSSEDQWESLYRIFEQLGGDISLRCRHQFCRMPGVQRRDNSGRYQTILCYL